jgi:hypothetical protein
MAHAEIPAIKLQQVESVHEPVPRPLSAVTPAACIRETMGSVTRCGAFDRLFVENQTR